MTSAPGGAAVMRPASPPQSRPPQPRASSARKRRGRHEGQLVQRQGPGCQAMTRRARTSEPPPHRHLPLVQHASAARSRRLESYLVDRPRRPRGRTRRRLLRLPQPACGAAIEGSTVRVRALTLRQQPPPSQNEKSMQTRRPRHPHRHPRQPRPMRKCGLPNRCRLRFPRTGGARNCRSHSSRLHAAALNRSRDACARATAGGAGARRRRNRPGRVWGSSSSALTARRQR